jgi:type IV pilus assembly protein PilM
MSLQSALLSVFPVPPQIAMPAAGIDISGGSVKSVLLSERGGVLALRSFAEVPLPDGAVVGGDIEQEDKMVEVLRSFRLRHGIRYASASLPERKAYLYRILVPSSTKDLRAGVEFSFESHVPLPSAEAIFDFEPVRKIEAGTIVAVTAYAKRIADGYRSVFEKSGILLRSLEVESQALARAVVPENDRAHSMLMIDFGKHTSRIAIVEYGVVAFTATVDVGGDALTQAVMKRMSVSEEEAEKIKNERGFLMNKDNADLVEALMSSVSVVKDEIVKHLTYWNSPSDNDVPRQKIEHAVICGGNANLRGFPEYLEGFLNVPVSIGNVWANAFSFDEYVPQMHFNESLEYATAIGLALRGRTSKPW